MNGHHELKAALSAVAATAGAGFASGRAMSLFFGQLGMAGWLGVAFASVCYGLLLSALYKSALRAGGRSPGDFLRRLLGRRLGAAASVLHGLLMSLTAAVMLVSAGELGALTLPVANGHLWGMALGLAAALGLCLSYNRAMPAAGAATVILGLLFYSALALDPRPARVYLRAETELALENSVGAAVLLAAMFAALSVSVSGDAALRLAHPRGGAGRVGLIAGGALGLTLAAANAALARGGRQLLGQAMPVVILAARWGAAGFWLCAGFSFLCAATTLAAALGALLGKLAGGKRERWAGVLLLVLTAVLAVTRSLDGAVARAYPALGWLCALGVGAVAGRIEGGG